MIIPNIWKITSTMFSWLYYWISMDSKHLVYNQLQLRIFNILQPWLFSSSFLSDITMVDLCFFDMNVLSQCFFLSKLKSIISYHNVLPTLKNEQKWSISFEQKNNQPSFLQISVISWKSIAHWSTFKRGDLCVCLSRQLGSAGSARSCFTSLPSPGDRLNRNNLEAMVGFTEKNRDLMEFSEI